MKLGQFEINSFVEQHFKLDGGSMFGVIPKTIWQRSIPADENNLIPMVTNIFVLRAHGKVILFDIGLGDTLSDKERKVYGTDGTSALESGLDNLGLKPHDVDYVILTHLHTDHVGGAVKLENGKYVPRFGKAQYIVSREEWEMATDPDERTRAVYIPERLYPLEKAGQVGFIDEDTDLFPGIRAVHTGGHTAKHFAIEIQSEGRKLFYYADIVGTSAHIKVSYVPAADLYPVETMEIKRKLLSRIVDRGVILAFDHDTKMPFGTVREVAGKLVVEPVPT